MNQNPYLSIVITGRNDDYGVNFLDRITSFIKSLDHQVRNWPNLIEIVVVEWNPLKDKPRLSEVLPKTSNTIVRIITVDSEIHEKFNTKIPVLEMYGKNTGIRRSNGEFVLVTNPDILFTQEIIDFFGSKKLSSDFFYRTDRHDFYAEKLLNQTIEKYVEFACENAFVSHCNNGSKKILNGSTLTQLPSSDLNSKNLHTNGSGDFILAHKSSFFKINGLYTSLEHRWHGDSYSVIRLEWSGLKQYCFVAPLCIFHQDHKRSSPDIRWSGETAKVKGRSLGEDNWGLAEHDLPEFRLGIL